MTYTKYTFSAVLLVSSFAVSAFAADVTVDQVNKTFAMQGGKIDTIEVKKGDTVHFVNKDSVFHNVFSLSPVKSFNTGPYEKGQKQSVKFDKAGTVDVECAIHPRMQLKVIVNE